MANNEYYTYNQGVVNGEIQMNKSVFNTIVEQCVLKLDNIELNSSVSCTVEDKEVAIEIHVKINYGANVSKTTKTLQKNINDKILELTDVKVKHINIIVDTIIFD